MKSRTTIITLAAVAVLALAAVSFAAGGRGYYGHGYGMMGNWGPGYGHGYGMMGDYGNGANTNLTDDQRAALDKAYQDFAAKTDTLRAELYSKNLELTAELAKSAPDQGRVATLTKEVNDLNAKLFAEQTAFRADLAKKFGIRGGYGYGMMGGYGGYGMMGGFGPGNCPFWGGSDTDRN
jgi:zinc resistance-associated protein